MLRPSLPIRTPRLLLRGFTMDDVDQVWAYQRLPEVARYMLWPPRDRPQTRAVVAQMAAETVLEGNGDCLTLAVTRDGAVIGQVELVWHSAENRQGEIGYVFHPAHHGQGFATEAARELLRLGFDELGLTRIVGRCAEGNLASANLMRRLGMRHEGQNRMFVKGAWRNELLFAVTRSPAS